MFNNKKGLAPIIATLLIIVITIVSAGIIWSIVLGGTVKDQLEQTSQLTCMNLGLTIESAVCADGIVTNDSKITVSRGKTTTYKISELAILLSDGTDSVRSSVTVGDNELQYAKEIKTYTLVDFNLEDAKMIIVIPILDSAGDKIECSSVPITKSC